MDKLSQIADAVWMVKPASFRMNEETLESNAFQRRHLKDINIHDQAIREFNEMVERLRYAGIEVFVSENPDTGAPDAIFPNNWISFHHNGDGYLFPMMAESRRKERRKELLSELESKFSLHLHDDLLAFEEDKKFLEGTGSIVFDHVTRHAFACESPRTDAVVFSEFCKRIKYEPVLFQAVDINGIPVYHTNVIMNIGTTYAVICFQSITDRNSRELIRRILTEINRELIEIDFDEMQNFSGNMLQVKAKDGAVTILSETAFDSLNGYRLDRLLEHTKLLKIKIPVIETAGGGSVRCMMAEIFLPKRGQ